MQRRDVQVLRSNFTKKDLWNPSWFPADFVKWAVPYEDIASNSGATPVWAAAQNGHTATVTELAGLGADVNIARLFP